jgi:putative FmdB family regulatory protein
MPIYCYRAMEDEKPCDYCREIFEVTQKMSEPALEVCPQCGAKIERIITSVYAYTDHGKEFLKDKNLKKMGFTKLVKEEKGRYRKVT